MSFADTLHAVGLTARICFPTVVDGLSNRVSLEACDARLDWWAKELLRGAHVDLHVRGVDNIPAGEPLVVMSNHRSYYDIPSVFCAIPGRMRMVAKKELFRVPLFGSAMLAAGFVKIDRDKREKALASLRESKRLLESGTRVWIAPEGTRSKDGRLGEFKSGGFHLALDAGVRILPVALTGTERVLGPASLVVTRGASVHVNILPPIDAPSYGKKGRKELLVDVRKAIATALGEPA